MNLLHHLFFKNLEHYLAIGTFLHNWYEDSKARQKPGKARKTKRKASENK